MRSRWALCWASTLLSQLADGMTYYSCSNFSQLIKFLSCVDPGGFEPPTFSMPLRRAPNCAMGPDFSDKFLCVQQPITAQVDLRGFEPLASSVRLRRAPNCATGPWI